MIGAIEARPHGRGVPPERIYAIFFLLTGIALAAACAPKTKYVEPASTPAAAYKENANWKPAEPSDQSIRGAWWEIFGDEQLNTLELRIGVSNQNLRMAAARFVEARAVVRGARSALYPQVGSNASISGARPSGNRAISPFHDA
jgi:outer membrane protein TolC